MRRGSRTRRVLKWGATVACGVLVGLWVVSGWWGVSWTQYFSGARYELSLEVVNGDIRASYYVFNERALSDWAQRGVKVESDFGIAPARRRGCWWTYSHWRPEGSDLEDGTRTDKNVVWGYWRGVKLSIGVPLLIIAVPTAFLWLSDRRRPPPGHCPKCGYNLTGNVSGRCPECGQKVTSRQEAPSWSGPSRQL